MFFGSGIAPHVFQFVKFPGFREHYVYYYVYIVDQYPLKVVQAFMMVRLFVASVFHFLLNVLRYGADLGRVIRLTNDEEIRNGFMNLSQVK